MPNNPQNIPSMHLEASKTEVFSWPRMLYLTKILGKVLEMSKTAVSYGVERKIMGQTLWAWT